MMQLSFWKRLLCAALTLALGVTLAACSDDDTKDDKLIPEIEVTQSLTFDCTETQTKNRHSCISPWQYNHVIQRLWTL